MCSVSVLSDWGRTAVPIQEWTKPAFDEFKQIMDKLNDLDAKLGQPDCEDPAKAAWMRDVEKRLAAIEDFGGRPFAKDQDGFLYRTDA